MKTPFVIYQGTFDPLTGGHLNIIKKALDLFGQVRVLLLVNPDKQPLFSVQERKGMIAAATADLPGVSIDSDSGLLVDYMRRHGVSVCVRGVRNAEDCAYELHNHALSRQLYPDIETLLLPCDPQWHEVSSSAVKAACAEGHLPSEWVPPVVLAALKKKFYL
ncbi:MAG: pantetheine-phosphate adenylyltransferase [Elusimicrobiaceae bacterium]|nr:pantetheine-phosphate adenylyltransferase [Elusimicrobiaceae bacterium]